MDRRHPRKASNIRRAALSLGVALLATACGGVLPPPPCLAGPPGILPLVVGDTYQMRSGRLRRRRCEADGAAYTWSAAETSVVHVTPSGLVRGLRPGSFEITGVLGTDTVGTYAFVMPRGWQLRIEPESATVHVGDSVAFRMVAFDSGGRTYSFAPFSLVTPEFLEDTREMLEKHTLSVIGGRPSLVMPRIVQTDTMPGVFRAEKPGVTTIIGNIGQRQDTARLVVVPR